MLKPQPFLSMAKPPISVKLDLHAIFYKSFQWIQLQINYIFSTKIAHCAVWTLVHTLSIIMLKPQPFSLMEKPPINVKPTTYIFSEMFYFFIKIANCAHWTLNFGTYIKHHDAQASTFFVDGKASNQCKTWSSCIEMATKTEIIINIIWNWGLNAGLRHATPV